VGELLSGRAAEYGRTNVAYFIHEWCQREHLLMSGTEEYPHASYDTLKETEEILRMKLRVDILNWNRLC
jgi:hypothetical protein